MSKQKYTDKDLLAILTEVEVEFKKHLNPETEGEKLAKAEVVAAPSQEAEVAYDEEDVAEMEKMYKSMSKSEAETHYKALKKAAFGEESAEVKKSEETKVVVKEESKEDKLLKSENETLKTENEALKKSLDNLAGTLSKIFGKNSAAPKQKAITDLEVIKKTEEDVKKVETKDLSKITAKEINSTLNAKIRAGDLKKSDKEAINQYFVDNKSIESIKHLL
jgi:hypothetical protein